MNKKSYKNLILVLIFQSKGKWSWYQLERELDWRGIGGKIKVVDVIKHLISENLVTEKIDPSLGAGMPYYFVTDDGADTVRELVSQFGVEAFSRKKESREDYS